MIHISEIYNLAREKKYSDFLQHVKSKLTGKSKTVEIESNPVVVDLNCITTDKITNEIIEQNGFKRINNSMWRKDNITLQNGYTNEGGNIYERILSTKKAFKVCIDGKYLQMIYSEDQLQQLLLRVVHKEIL